jgi:hypothetical protein
MMRFAIIGTLVLAQQGVSGDHRRENGFSKNIASSSQYVKGVHAANLLPRHLIIRNGAACSKVRPQHRIGRGPAAIKSRDRRLA